MYMTSPFLGVLQLWELLNERRSHAGGNAKESDEEMVTKEAGKVAIEAKVTIEARKGRGERPATTSTTIVCTGLEKSLGCRTLTYDVGR